jgi:hypothetical protein
MSNNASAMPALNATTPVSTNASNANKKNNAANKKNNANAAFANLAKMSNAVEEKPANAAVGGRRRTKRAKSSKRGTQKGGKISKGASKWNQFVMRTFKDMRKKNKSVKLMDAMKECSKQKKKGVKY